MGGRIIREEKVTRNGHTAREVLMIIDVDEITRKLKPKL